MNNLNICLIPFKITENTSPFKTAPTILKNVLPASTNVSPEPLSKSSKKMYDVGCLVIHTFASGRAEWEIIKEKIQELKKHAPKIVVIVSRDESSDDDMYRSYTTQEAWIKNVKGCDLTNENFVTLGYNKDVEGLEYVHAKEVRKFLSGEDSTSTAPLEDKTDKIQEKTKSTDIKPVEASVKSPVQSAQPKAEQAAKASQLSRIERYKIEKACEEKLTNATERLEGSEELFKTKPGISGTIAKVLAKHQKEVVAWIETVMTKGILSEIPPIQFNDSDASTAIENQKKLIENLKTLSSDLTKA